jgi:site-specific recombinase XerD
MLTDRTAHDARILLDVCGRRRSPATFRDFHEGRPPRNKGQQYPADPPGIAEIVQVMKACPETISGRRTRALILLLWRSGLRISEALALHEQDLNERDRSIFVRNGKGNKSRKAAMDEFGWQELRPWLEERKTLPVGTVFPIVTGPTAGRAWCPSGARTALKRAAKHSGVRRRIHPHGFRHAHAVELAREGIPIHLIQRQLGHGNLAVTAVYLAGIGNGEVLEAIGARRAPMVPAM